MGDPPINTSALTESLQLLAEDNTDFFDEFTIDSDDEDIFPTNENRNILKAQDDTTASSSPSMSQSQSTTATTSPAPSFSSNTKYADKNLSSSPAAAAAATTTTLLNSSNSGSVSALKKETVSATEDPLASWQQPQPLKVQSPANVNYASGSSGPAGGGSGAMMMPSTQQHAAISSASSSVANLVSSKTAASISSTFSSFASKFQDAVHSVGVVGVGTGTGTGVPSSAAASNTNTNVTATGIVSQPHYPHAQQQQRRPLSNPSMNTNYVNRSAAGMAAVPVHGHGHGHAPTANGIKVQGIHAGGNVPQSSNVGGNATKIYGSSAVSAVGNASANMNVNANATSSATATISPELKHLDNAKKSALIKSAIGKLLPGEEVIMFLCNLQNVTETSSPHTGVGSSSLFGGSGAGASGDLVWCCAMTFYRIIVFSYHESEFLHLMKSGVGASASANNANVSNSGGDDMCTSANGAHTEDINQWIKSASVSRQFQYFHSSHQIRTNGKRHFVMQMPLASIDRVEKSTEFASSSSVTSSTASSIIGGTMGMNISGIGGYGVGVSVSGDSSLGGASVASGTLVIHGKDNGRFIKFTAPSYADCMRAYEALDTYAFPGKRNLGYLFAFESRRIEVQASVKNMSDSLQGGGGAGISAAGGGPGQSKMGRITCVPTPRRYDALVEFSRMVRTYNDGAANVNHQIQCPWRPLAKANQTYNSCQSYPSILFGPSFVNDETPEGMRVIRQIAGFRSGNRFQTMSWASRYDGASIWRCAQPKVGLQGNRSTADEMYIKKIGECAALANTQAALSGKMPKRPSTAFLRMLTGGINESDMMLDTACRENAAFTEKCMVKILDLRPKSSAMANRTAGYGYENTSYYKNTTLSFHGIGNIHVVRDSYQKLSALCANPSANDLQWHQLVEDTKWLPQLRAILSASWQTAFHVRYNRLPVLVHCSHGWDRTSQVSALAQIFLDPFFRTRTGFSCLVEKEFLALGHPFHLRCGHGEGRGDRNNGSGGSSGQVDEAQMSPIFIQFLDCVFQLVSQYPDYFEFNTKYLLLISEHVYSCRFGTLLCDTEREREAVASIRQRTHCLWEYLDSFPQLLNKNYVEDSLAADEFEGNGAMLMPLPSLLRNVTLWVDRFCMHGAKPTSRCLQHGYDPVHVLSEEEQLLFNGNGNFHEKAVFSAHEQAVKWKKIAEEKDKEIQELKRQLSLQEEAKIG